MSCPQTGSGGWHSYADGACVWCGHAACVLRIVDGAHIVQHSPGCTCAPCSNCNGSGFTPSDRPALCTICRGIGYVPGDEFWEDG